MKRLAPIALVVLIAAIVAAFWFAPKTQNVPDLDNIQELEYYSVEEPKVDTTYIQFYFCNVVDYICYVERENEDDLFTIEYDDPDCFDYDYLMENSGDTLYRDYIVIEVARDDFSELLHDMDLSVTEKAYLENDAKWLIMEIATPMDNRIDYKYYLQKYVP